MTCNRTLHEQPFHATAERYSIAVNDGAEAVPILIPSYKNPDIFDHLSGILFTGSVSNIEPHHYSNEESRPGTMHDPQRDEVSFYLMREAIKRNLPFLCICRGNQELNVAMGGSLFQNVHEIPFRQIHHEDLSIPIENRFLPAHEVILKENGFFHKLYGKQRIMVNTLHHQAINQLGQNLQIDATAPDGTIEAITVKDHPFGISVQWHPEWRLDQYKNHKILFQAFGEAARKFTA